MDREKVIDRVKLLLKLAESPNENEAANAKTLADKLIAKQEIKPNKLTRGI